MTAHFVLPPCCLCLERSQALTCSRSCFGPYRHQFNGTRLKYPAKGGYFAKHTQHTIKALDSKLYDADVPHLNGISGHTDDDFIVSDDEEVDVADTDTAELKRRNAMLEKGIPVPGVSQQVIVEFAPGKEMTFETGRIARQAAGAVITRIGGTIVYCTACCENEPSANVDFLPLRVDYIEKFSAAGRTSGSYTRREGRPNDDEILASRFIDRPLRPMIQHGYHNELQLLATVFSHDKIHEADSLAICGCAAALHISKVPLRKAVAGVKVGSLDGNIIINPTIKEIQRCQADIIVAGTRDGILMVEGRCEFFTEEQVLEMVVVGHNSIAKICDALDKLRSKVGREKDTGRIREVSPDLVRSIEKCSDGLDEALAITAKKEREVAVRVIKDRVFNTLSSNQEERLANPEESQENDVLLRMAWKAVCASRMRIAILEHNLRPDGRGPKDVRPITIDRGVLPCAHGSAIFTRGETQALAVATLGANDMAQRIDSVTGDRTARFYLQYSFPPFSVGEVGRIGAPGRREIGHGKLAERALIPTLPNIEDFPYVIRLESNILESNGSSSMASVCGGSLAMMEAGVPVKRPVAGIAMGLILDAEHANFAILTDILGMEDALGDMDFKVAGDDEGLTALQMDIKVEGVTLEIMKDALAQAKEGRSFILKKMLKALPATQPHLHPSVPKVSMINVPIHRIGEIIGPGGKTIKSIIERSGGDGNITINVNDEGIISLASESQSNIDAAINLVSELMTQVEVGQKVTGVVSKVLPFGAYVALAGGKEAWLHISELEEKRTARVEDVCKEGDSISVSIIEVGRNGNVKVSRKAYLSEGSRRINSGRQATKTSAGLAKGAERTNSSSPSTSK